MQLNLCVLFLFFFFAIWLFSWLPFRKIRIGVIFSFILLDHRRISFSSTEKCSWSTLGSVGLFWDLYTHQKVLFFYSVKCILQVCFKVMNMFRRCTLYSSTIHSIIDYYCFKMVNIQCILKEL